MPRVRLPRFLRKHLCNHWAPLAWWAAPYAMVKMVRIPADGLAFYWCAILVSDRGVQIQMCEHRHEKREEARACAVLMRDRARRSAA